MLSSQFEASQSSKLQLPQPKAGETPHEVAQRGLETALSILHDARTMISLNPLENKKEPIDPAMNAKAVDVQHLSTLFKSRLQDDQDTSTSTSTSPSTDLKASAGGEWQHFEITEYIPLVLGLTKTLVFQTAIRRTRDGMDALTNPGSGVLLHGNWKVAIVSDEDNDTAALLLSETTSARCSALLAWYIRGTLEKSHTVAHKEFRRIWEERMRVTAS